MRKFLSEYGVRERERERERERVGVEDIWLTNFQMFVSKQHRGCKVAIEK